MFKKCWAFPISDVKIKRKGEMYTHFDKVVNHEHRQKLENMSYRNNAGA